MSTIKHKGKAILFNNRFFELLTRTHPAIIVSIYVPFSGFLLWYYHTNVQSSYTWMILLFLAGVILWTFTEYILHRFVFHYIDESTIGKKFHYVVHGVHHEYPKDKERLVMPPIPSIFIASFFFIIFKLLIGTSVYAFLPGFIIGYLIYAMVHYSIHAFAPPKYFKILWIHHSIHHYKSPDKAFGVSSPLWDYIFHTMPD